MIESVIIKQVQYTNTTNIYFYIYISIILLTNVLLAFVSDWFYTPYAMMG